MRTKTFFWPNEKNATTEIEVSRDGSIVRAESYVPDCDCMGDVTASIKERNVWVKRCAEFAEAQDWNDHGDNDWALERFKEEAAKIIGIKPA